MIRDQGGTVGESDVIIPLPEGDYAGHAVIRGSDQAGAKRRITITMLEGENIPFCEPDGVITNYEVIAEDLNGAVKDLVHVVNMRRSSNHYSARRRPATRAVQRVAMETLHKVRLTRSDGVVVEVPANTRALPLEPTSPGTSAKNIYPLFNGFDDLAMWIERWPGKCVFYKPTPDSTELHVGTVERKP